MKYQIPNVGGLEIETVILDLNGTLSVYGQIKKSTKNLLRKLIEKDFEVILLTGDHRGTAKKLSEEIGLKLVKVSNGKEKKDFFQKINNGKICSIGNARIDIGTFEGAALSIATLQKEGIHAKVLEKVDILMTDIDDALNLLLDKNILEATMRV